jgi:hypothetical protein
MRALKDIGMALFGIQKIKYPNNQYMLNFDSILYAGTLFIVGIPVGGLLLPTSFSITVWMFIVLTTLILLNLDNVADTIVEKTSY